MQLTEQLRRWYNPIPRGQVNPLVRLDDTAEAPLTVAHTDIASLRGVTDAAADVSECMCPEPCERDHANE
jgi:hypothetical protein